MKRAWVISICFLYVLHMNAQKEEILIKQFVHDLFDVNIPEKVIEENYLSKLKPEKKNHSPLEEREHNRLGHITVIRKEMIKNESDDSWLIPNKINADPKNSVANYLEYKHLDKFRFSERKKKRLTKRMFVLLNKNKDKILQYFFMEKGKIKSFSLFVKSGHASFFVY